MFGTLVSHTNPSLTPFNEVNVKFFERSLVYFVQCVVASERDLLGAAFELASSRRGHHSVIHAFWIPVDRDTVTHSDYGVLWDGAKVLSALLAEFRIW